MTRPMRSRKAMVLLYALGIMAIVISLGAGIRSMGAQVAQGHSRGMFQDAASWAAMSGITYGKRHIQELWRGAARPFDGIYGGNGYPGVTARRSNGNRQWLGGAWTGLFTSPRSHEDANPGAGGFQWDARNGAGIELRLGNLRHEPFGAGALRGMVYARVRLDETIIRNGFFFGELEHEGFAPPGYDPKVVVYFLESIGRVDIPHPADPANRGADRVASLQRAILSFQLPVGPLNPVPPPPANPVTFYRERMYQDRVLEFRGR